jgi:hypothetical protein
LEENVHIVPTGYEIDRIVKPFEGPRGFKANKVYLLSTVEGTKAPEAIQEQHEHYASIVKERLERLGISVVIVPTNLIDILEVLNTVSRIILEERAMKNNVYINMSGAGRLTSVGATLSGMVHGVKVYYVESDGYADEDPRMKEHGYTLVVKPKVTVLENFKIILPDGPQLKVLSEINRRGSMRTMDIIDYLIGIKSPGFEIQGKLSRSPEKNKVIMRANHSILEKLEGMGLVERKRVGRRSEYKVTGSGKYMVSISGLQ